MEKAGRAGKKLTKSCLWNGPLNWSSAFRGSTKVAGDRGVEKGQVQSPT